MHTHITVRWVLILTLVAIIATACAAPATPTTAPQPTAVPAQPTRAVVPPTAVPPQPTTAVAQPTAAAAQPTTAPPQPTAATQKTVDEIVIAQLEEAPTLDPQLNWTMGARNLYYQVAGYLMFHDANMNPAGELAEKWDWVGDRAIKYYLRKNVKFHNGEPFNAAAVKFSLERIMDPKTKSPWMSTLTSLVDKIEVLDDYTIQITGKTPSTNLLLEIGRMPLVPPKYITEKGDAYFAANPVGTGAFKFVEAKAGDRVVFERYMDYWQGPSPIKRIVFRVVPEETTRVAELLAGKTDIARIPPQAVEQVNNSKIAHAVLAPSVQSLRMSFASGTSDKNLRQAVAYAINTDSIIKNIMQGQARRVKGALSPMVFGADPTIAGYDYSVAKAKEALAKSSYKGEAIPFAYPEGRIPKGREVAEAITSDLAAAGIKVNLKPMEYGVWFDTFYKGKLEGITMSTTTVTTGDPNVMLRDNYTPTTIGYHTYPELDAVIKPVVETTDPVKRKPMVNAAEKYIVDNVYWLTLYDLDLVYGVSNKIDWMPRPNDLMQLFTIKVR